MLISFFRIIKFAWQDFARNIWLSTVVIVVLVLALSSVNALVGLNVLTDQMIGILQNKVNVSVFLSADISEAELANLQSYLVSQDEVKEIVYISPDQGLAEFKETHKDDPAVLEALAEIEDNPLLPTLIIHANDTKDFDKILAVLDSSQYAPLIQDKNFDDHEKIINRINTFSDKARFFGMILVGLFALISVLLIYNAIRIMIYIHKREIGIMRLVGATNRFIRLPFVAESALYGIFAMIFATLIFYGVAYLVNPYLASFLGEPMDFIVYLNNNFVQVFGIQLAAVLLLNIFSSGLAIAKYLKV